MTLKLKEENIKIIKATDFKTRLIGLMGQKNINYGILFPNCNAIHTFFMKENINVFGLNKDNQVIFIYLNVPKNKIVKVSENNKNTSILELPKNAGKSLHIGSVLKFID